MFAFCHTQPALYYSNQNQYFLHGLARAGVGQLQHDWLANTHDPTPLFSLIIQYFFSLGTWTYHALFFLLLMLYALSMWWIIQSTRFKLTNGTAILAWWTGWTLLHAGALRVLSAQWTGVDYPWYFQAGVANQYLLGAGLQPSVFGVLLLTSLAAWGHQRSWIACVLAALAALFHSTYLMPGGAVVAAIMIHQFLDQKQRVSFLQGLIALGIVTPVLIQSHDLFLSASTENVQEAHRVIAQLRIPHHCQIHRWLDGIAVAQLLWCLLSLVLLRRELINWCVVGLVMVGGTLTLIQVATSSDSLALIFPWRVSVILVPVTTALVLAWIVKQYVIRHDLKIQALSWIMIIVICISTLYVYRGGYCYPTSAEEDRLFSLVRHHTSGPAVYLIPTKFPKPSNSRGTSSSSFLPLARSTSAIFELQRFRLETGLPIYVDFKSIPYKTDEVMEWKRRINAVESWYATEDWNNKTLLADIESQGITHVLWPASRTGVPRNWPLLGEAAGFKIYKTLTAKDQP